MNYRLGLCLREYLLEPLLDLYRVLGSSVLCLDILCFCARRFVLGLRRFGSMFGTLVTLFDWASRVVTTGAVVLTEIVILTVLLSLFAGFRYNWRFRFWRG